MKRHRIRGGFTGVRHRDHNRVFVDRDHVLLELLFGQFFTEVGAGRVNAAIVKATGYVCEVDPFKEAVFATTIFGERFDLHVAVDDCDRVPRFKRFD